MSNVPSASEVPKMDAFTAMGIRRSIRWYEPHEPVERWKIQVMLEAARQAPTAGNYNGQRAIVVYRDEDPEIWEFISDWSQITTQMAPVLVFWMYDMANYDTQGQSLHDIMRTGGLDKAHGWEYDRVNKLFPLPAMLPDAIMHRLAAIDLGNAIQNALIAASALGLATCLNGASGGARRNVKAKFNLPDTYTFCWLMTLGYPAESMDGGGRRPRPPFETMYFEGKVGNPYPRDPEVVKLSEDLNLLQPKAPLPGRLEEINKLTRRFGLGDEYLTDWKLEESQLGEEAGDKRLTPLSKEEILASVEGAEVDDSFVLHPTVKREELESYREKRGISETD